MRRLAIYEDKTWEWITDSDPTPTPESEPEPEPQPEPEPIPFVNGNAEGDFRYYRNPPGSAYRDQNIAFRYQVVQGSPDNTGVYDIDSGCWWSGGPSRDGTHMVAYVHYSGQAEQGTRNLALARRDDFGSVEMDSHSLRSVELSSGNAGQGPKAETCRS